MKYLVDTHVWLWLVLEPSHLKTAVVEALADENNIVYLSSASVHEIVIKHALGKLTLPTTPQAFINAHADSAGMTPLPITFAHVLEVANLPSLHRDPFDRLLVAQARCESLTLVTSDPAIIAYPATTLVAR